MLFDLRLDEEDALPRGKPHTQPVDHHFLDGLLNDFRVAVLGRQGVPVRCKEKTFILFLKLLPIVQGANQIS